MSGRHPSRAIAGVLCTMAALSLAACSRGSATPTPMTIPTIAASAPPTATPTASFEQQVSAAYLAYRDAYSAALLNLDVSRVQGFAIGAELRRIGEEIEMLRAQGVAMRVVEQRNFAVASLPDGNKAVVIDRYVSNSFYVDPITKDPPTARGTGNVIQDNFVLDRIDGRWVVSSSNRQR